MTAEPRQAGRRWTVDDIFEHRYTVIGLLVVLVVCMLVILWLLFSMSRYEREGDEFFGKTKYDQALERYIKALQHQTFSGKDRLLFKVAQTLSANDDPVRAMDFILQLVTEYPDDNYYRVKGESLARKLHETLFNDALVTPALSTELGSAREQFRKSYGQLLSLLKGGPGDEGHRRRTQRFYEQYKTLYEQYQKVLSSQYKEAVAREAATREQRREATSDQQPATSSEQ